MKNTLNIEHLLQYLPYSLKFKHVGDNVSDYGEYLTMSNVSAKSEISLIVDDGKGFTIQNFDTVNFEFLPILKPLSNLKNDDEFWNEFYIIFGGGMKNIEQFKRSWGNEILLDPLALGYKYWIELIKRHYDVFYLIDKGLAIDYFAETNN
jgi:hypothetical protein